MAGLAICAVARDEARSIAQWVAFHLLQGADLVRVLDDGSTDGTTDLLHAMAAIDPRIEVAPWHREGDNFDAAQQKAYGEAALEMAGRFAFIACIDIDEYLHASDGRILSDHLAGIAPDIAAIAVGETLFGSSGHGEPGPGLVIERFTRCAPPGDEAGRWFKTIARPEQVERYDSVHSVVLRGGRYVMADLAPLERQGHHPGQAARAAQGVIALHHYRVKSLGEFREKQHRWRDRDITPRYADMYYVETELAANRAENASLRAHAPALRAMLARLGQPAPPPCV